MRLGKIALGLWLLCGAAVSAEVVPGWFVLELMESPIERTRNAARVRTSQAAVRQSLAARLGGRVAVRDTTEVVMNALIVQTGAAETELATVPGVRRVWPVYTLQRNLDRAIEMMQVDKAWTAIGGSERAGAGIKVAIMDSGLDLNHPGFKTTTMTPPSGYPRATNDAIRDSLNGKVIVYRTYDEMFGFAESAADNSGHGTGVAMAAAGLRVKSPRAELQGVAPGAWLGIYKIFVGPNGERSNSAAAIKALDDAVADGMDVVNMSFGFLPQGRPELDPMRPALARAAALGVMVVKANGNSGPGRATGAFPTPGQNGLSVGASRTDRVFATGIRVNAGDPVFAVPGDSAPLTGSIRAPLRDLTTIDASGLACGNLPPGSLTGSAVLILRGTCTFEQKINAAQAAGAVAAIIYTHADSPEAGIMIMATATLPAVMISNRDGLRVKAVLTEQTDPAVEIAFEDTLPIPINSEVVSPFSSRGPGADGSIQPDLVAIGERVLTAAQSTNPNGDLYDPSGFVVIDGSSFSSPLLAGAYAVLKAARPGLRPEQYRALLVNTAQPFPAAPARPAPVQVGGAGRLDLLAALRGQLAMDPPTISFGLGGQRVDANRIIRIRNLDPGPGSWRVEVDSVDDAKATVEPQEFSLGSGETTEVTVRLRGDLQLGEYQGFLLFRRVDAPESERPARVPYWYGVPTGRATAISFIPSPRATEAPSATIELTALITDAIGAGTPAEAPRVTVLEGAAEFLSATSEENNYPGYWTLRIRMSAVSGQVNRFRIEAGTAVREFSIRTR